ncbi:MULTISPECIES: efflux RND transporter periplasmic adaptor subunit [Dysgonomonas]|uniref:Cation efflux system protein n=1 Tax=uncultured Dysgonomonas sp. TaxID=206096 RepID=A0A212JM41_9BACT|nr:MULTISPECIES: efflux RND transporter periplasmic adaptor subunit [Dysgonomonas]MBN9303455.1 efflux RND transporter periplasmic adaptor subunit [Dysgonomonas mossii]OJX56120.1 MAG: hypothetical protein BGO84_07560 [Dysgonomonas sp. 37-18]SBW00481.1 Cation efflux system protein [uncultured Dysgonomonas sp.]
MKNRYIILIITMIFILLTAVNCKKEVNRNDESVPVDIISIKPVLNSPIYNYSGIIEESYSSMISFQVTGNIQQIYCGENQHVKKGTLLANLDKVVHQNSYDMALSTYKQAEDAYNRLKILYDDNSLPEIKWIETQTALQNAKSMVNIAKNNLDNCNLYAPFSGVVAKKITEVGANVMPGVPVFNLVKLEKIKIKVAIPEKEVSQISIGQKAIIKIMALDENAEYTAFITEKSSMANPLSHTYDIKIELDNETGTFMPGMICDVTIMYDKNEDEEIIIPNNSIMIDNDNNRFVWKVENDIAYKQSVIIDKLSDKGVIIKEGLCNGDLIIINGNQKVSAGMKVKIR